MAASTPSAPAESPESGPAAEPGEHHEHPPGEPGTDADPVETDRPRTPEEWEARHGRPPKMVGLVGKVRRFGLTIFQPKETERLLAKRDGDCDRCGLCCRIVFRCPWLKDHGDGSSSCTIYDRRPTQCAKFPIDPRDLRDVSRCSYTFRP